MSFPMITKTAKYVPVDDVSNKELSQIMETTDEWIMSRTGISNRHIAFNETTSDLASTVAQQLVSGIDCQTIDFIIVATMTPDFATPSTACLVQNKIGAANAFAFDINAACSGFVYALNTAEKFLSSGRYQRGIVIGAETMSNVINWHDRSTAVLFGDGAGGVLIENTSEEQRFLAEIIQSDGSRSYSLQARQQKKHHPFKESEETVGEFLEMDGKKIFDFVLRDVSKQVSNILEETNVHTIDIDYVLAHQANERILDMLSKKTNISREKFLSNVREYGNTSAASIPILLSDMIDKGTLVLNSQQLVVMTGFGGGLTWSSLLIKL
ncbi:beta-ketoacyl-ACP synthase III [Vagococcus vulneris]|uniref:Beta-ketoacyl-[acyl-carrier-protein] synthase III n=1 Tax=Vagococcus vulneris TaxID=1977869 RepID=A0A429ZZ88_9ENTE|nr:beta-ketoacyl-ACP synthase III [Vagococcus vulneris]RST99296.1 3-oxoacyl-ACP synthase [Vagococcus vulneris]